ncbi:MAG: carbon-nitrogen hydrolase family protein [Acidobacteriaceae bacterium]
MNGLNAKAENTSGQAESNEKLKGGWEDGLGRPVRIASIGYMPHIPLERIAQLVDEQGARGTDIILLPETCRGQDQSSEEPLHGATVTALSGLAKKHKTYVACPIDRRDGSRRLNSIVLLDRSGQVACIYDKAFPYWSEFDLQPAVAPAGEAAHVHQADFGRLGLATCFDVNFPEVWKQLSDQGAEVVVWPSAYSAGVSLQAHAINHHYYIVTSSQTPDCIVYDITGERLLYERAQDVNVSRVTLDLDRVLFHENFNLAKRDKLLNEHGPEVAQEQWLRLEQWFVLRAKTKGVSARELSRSYGLEELRHYLDRSRVAIDQRRGWEFAKGTVAHTSQDAELNQPASLPVSAHAPASGGSH